MRSEEAAALAAGLPFAQARERFAALGHAVREKHSGGASSLLVDDGGADELVVHYPPSGAPRAWRVPADPELPHLGGVPELLRGDSWEPPLGPELAGAAVETRLMYNPARRAAFLLRPPASPAPVVLRLLSAAEAPASLAALRAVAASPLAGRVPMPHLLAAAPAQGALLLDYLPGTPVADWTPDVVEEVAAVLDAVHRSALAGLPRWSPERDVTKLERLLALLRAAEPAAAGALEPAAHELAARLSGSDAPATTIHRDFTKRHVLLVPHRPGAPQIGILDWDSVSTGPPEKDLATIAAGLGAEGAQLIGRYERVAERRLDRELVNALVQIQRLTRACRRLLAGERAPEWAAQAAGAVEAALRSRPLAAT